VLPVLNPPFSYGRSLELEGGRIRDVEFADLQKNWGRSAHGDCKMSNSATLSINPDPYIATIAAQNDAFRKAICGQPVLGKIPQGKLVVTASVDAQGPLFVMEALRQVGTFEAFNEDADPDHLHEMGVIEIETLTVWWKIDLYDLDYHFGSDDPDNPDQTRRVLTILFPSDY